MRRAAKRDLSEGPIVQYLRKAGWSVLHLSVANGPDLVCGKFGATVLIECKTGKGKLRPGQVKWGQDWQGDPPYVIRTVQEAEALTKAINKLRRK
jgi:Holliday junction resolvase